MADILSATTLLLTLIGLLYTVWYPELTDALDTKLPEFPEDRKKPLRKVRSALNTKAVPLVAFAAVLSIAFLPVAISIAAGSVGQLARSPHEFFSNYDPVATAFFLVVLGACAFTAHLVSLVVRLIALRRGLASAK